MNDSYISTESLNKQLDEAYNRGIEDCLVVVAGIKLPEGGFTQLGDLKNMIKAKLKPLKK